MNWARTIIVAGLVLAGLVARGQQSTLGGGGGGGGSATNAIPLLNGSGTNTTLRNVTVVSGTLAGNGAALTNLVTITNAATLYLDPVAGNDTTAVRGLRERPWKTLHAANTNSQAGDTFLLAPGTYDTTNVFYLSTNQTLRGAGRAASFVRWWGYSSNSVQVAAEDWVCIALTTNTLVADLDVKAMVSGANVYSACIGRSTNTTGASDFVVERVNMHGDTDNFYIDNGGYFKGKVIDCITRSAWDTYAIISEAEGSDITIVNPDSENLGPSVSTAGSRATCLRLAGSHALSVRVIGGRLKSNGVIADNPVKNLTLYDTHVENTNTYDFLGSATLYGVNTTFERCRSSANAPAYGAADATAIVNIYSPAPQSGQENNYISDPLAGVSYWNTNLGTLRVFDGLQWQSAFTGTVTNKLRVSNSGDASFDGDYTLKALVLDGKPGFSMTNAAGKFLLYTTDVNNADWIWGLSANETLVDGLEYDGSVFLLSRGWGTFPNIRVGFVPMPYQLPTMTKATRNAITGLTNGAAIYQTDSSSGLYVYNGTTWVGGSGTLVLTNYPMNVWLTNSFGSMIDLTVTVSQFNNTTTAGNTFLWVPGYYTNSLGYVVPSGGVSTTVYGEMHGPIPPGVGFAITNSTGSAALNISQVYVH